MHETVIYSISGIDSNIIAAIIVARFLPRFILGNLRNKLHIQLFFSRKVDLYLSVYVSFLGIEFSKVGLKFLVL